MRLVRQDAVLLNVLEGGGGAWGGGDADIRCSFGVGETW